MLQESIGLIETRGLVGAVGAADAAVKAGNINLLAFELIGGGLVSVKFRGDVAAVQVAVQAGIEAARGVSELVSHNVIAAPDKALSDLLTSNATASELIIAEEENSDADNNTNRTSICGTSTSPSKNSPATCPAASSTASWGAW